MCATLLKNMSLYSSGHTGEQLGQRRVSILEEYRVTCAQCVKGDPMIEPFHSSTVEDTQRLQSHSSVYQKETKGRSAVDHHVPRTVRHGIFQTNIIV